jgi:Ca2+-binding EF-hand superfamily protein
MFLSHLSQLKKQSNVTSQNIQTGHSYFDQQQHDIINSIDNPELVSVLLAAKSRTDNAYAQALTKSITGTEAEIQTAYLMAI